MKKIAILLFLIAMIGAASASYDCNVFTGDGNGHYTKDQSGSTVLCNWNDLNTLIQKNNELDTNNQRLATDLNNSRTAEKQYFDEAQLARAETNLYKPKATELEGKLSECDKAKAAADAAKNEIAGENAKLTNTIYTMLDDINYGVGAAKTHSTATMLLISDYITKDKNQLTTQINKAQENYQTISTELFGIGILVLLPMLYLARKKIKIPKLNRKKQEQEQKIKEIMEKLTQQMQDRETTKKSEEKTERIIQQMQNQTP
jgi:uncharacterized membrane protein YciS (DUF1049 family)